jgi:hypothetical protein
MTTDHTTTIGPLTFIRTLETDDDVDLSHLGEWYARNGTPPYPYYDTWADCLVVSDKDDDSYEAYTLMHGEKVTSVEYMEGVHTGNPRNWRFITGMQNSDALNVQNRWKCMLLDARRLWRYGDHWHMVGVQVVAKLDGVEIDREALWGIESDSEDSYFAEVETDCISEIMGRLDTTAARLRKDAEALEDHADKLMRLHRQHLGKQAPVEQE